MFTVTGSANYKISSVKENGPITYSPPTDSLSVKGKPGTTVCSISSKVLPAVDCMLVVPRFTGRGGTYNSGAQRRHLCAY